MFRRQMRAFCTNRNPDLGNDKGSNSRNNSSASESKTHYYFYFLSLFGLYGVIKWDIKILETYEVSQA